MNSTFWIIISWVRKEDMQLLKSIAELNRDTMIGQNYMYWNDKEVAEYYKELFDFDEEVYILAVEEINDFRKTMKIYR